MHLEEFMAVLMLFSLVLLLCIYKSKSNFILQYEKDLSNFFYGVDKVNNSSWQNIIFLFIIIFSVDIFFKKISTEKKSVFFPKLSEKNKPFGLFPNAYDENLIVFYNKHKKWIKIQIILNIIFMLFGTIFFMLYILKLE